jgi:hypothetical protein
VIGRSLFPNRTFSAARSWNPKYWIFPRDLFFADKAGRVLDLYAGVWEDEPLGPQDYILSADEKTGGVLR